MAPRGSCQVAVIRAHSGICTNDKCFSLSFEESHNTQQSVSPCIHKSGFKTRGFVWCNVTLKAFSCIITQCVCVCVGKVHFWPYFNMHRPVTVCCSYRSLSAVMADTCTLSVCSAPVGLSLIAAASHHC